MGAQAVRLSNVDIDKALDNKDFEVRFQPIFDLGNGALARMETFVRWRHPSLGVLPPGAFISFFETQGRMSELTRFVLGAALKAYTEWRGACAPGFSLNLALSDLSDEAFSSHFIKLLRDYQFPADLVTLECPMPAVDTDIDIAAAQFARIGSTGARLAIEVRGRANDLLRNIDPFPFDEIKTGGSSILRFARTVRGPGLSAISDLLEIANDANAVITAVGVEDQTALAALRGLGFTAAQGNHLGKVGDINDFLPSHVNKVRNLLGLEELSTESLTALFRTDAPAPQVNELEAVTIDDDVQSDSLIDRLSNRIDSQQDTPADTPDQANESDIEEQRKAKAREKAKILAVAKRERARDMRKAAAIARAKAKNGAGDDGSGNEQDTPPNTAPRDLQQRLSEEFANAQNSSNNDAASISETDRAEDPAPHTIVTKAAPVSIPGDDDRSKKLSVPEKLAAAAKAAETKSATPPVTDNTPRQKSPIKIIKMPVGVVDAYFQPGIIVGGPAFNQKVVTPSTASAAPARKQPDAAPSIQPSRVASTGAVPPTENIPAEAAPSAVAPNEPQTEPGDEGDLYGPHLQQPTPARSKRRKGFLKRTVLPYPTHFWPKTWVRSYRRMTAKQPANDTTENIIQAAE